MRQIARLEKFEKYIFNVSAVEDAVESGAEEATLTCRPEIAEPRRGCQWAVALKLQAQGCAASLQLPCSPRAPQNSQIFDFDSKTSFFLQRSIPNPPPSTVVRCQCVSIDTFRWFPSRVLYPLFPPFFCNRGGTGK